MELWNLAFGSTPGEFKRIGPSAPCVLTLGNFDGVHSGHRRLIGDAVASAKEQRLPMVAVTFDPHPVKFLSPENHPGLLMTLAQKLSIFDYLGVSAVWVIPFSREFSELAPYAFLDGLRETLNPVELHVGRAFRFGRDRAGELSCLQTWGADNGCAVCVHAFKTPDGGPLSSSRIRQTLMNGDVALASELLGAPFTLTGVVVEGDRRGRQLGFPTANLAWEQELLPAPGVYVTTMRCAAHLAGSAPGLTNIGVKPTFNGRSLTVETHLPKMDVNLYGSKIELEFLARIRGEEKFEKAELLRAKITEDIKYLSGFH
jgi:riboflavin kinase/FMN adenylyltransferase